VNFEEKRRGICMKLKYFAYGSNMCTARLRGRVPSCVPVTIARLGGYQLRFHKRSKDGSAKCNSLYTGAADDEVWGVIFDIPKAEKPKLDSAEGLGAGYNDHEVEVVTTAGEKVKTRTYLADASAITEGLLPYTWYKAYVLKGALECGLPKEYISQFIEAIPAVKDPRGDE
jgi:cation transport regulator ChaC